MAVHPVSRNVPRQVARARSSVARKIQLGAAPEVIEAARADLAAASAEAAVRRIVAAAPSLTEAQRAELALILHPGGSDAT